MFVEMVALKLTIFGWSLILMWLCWKRAKEVYMGASYNAVIRPLGGPTALMFSAVMAISNVVGYFAPIVDNVMFGDMRTHHPLSHTITMIGMLILISIMVDRFAYSRVYKLKWESGWLIFVHVMIWGREWMTG